jgi:hypothetical protein
MMFHETQKQVIAQAGGVRRVELRYSGDIDESGHFRLKRCVGKSLFEKFGQINTAQSADADETCRFSELCPDKSA